MEDDTHSFTKRKYLQRERLSNEKLWFHVGTVFNVFMRPLFSGQIIVVPQYSCGNDGLSGIDDDSTLRNNMIVVYNRESRCIQQDGLNFNLKDITVKIMKNLIKLVASNMKKLTLNVDNIIENSINILCLSSFRERYPVYTSCIDCGEEAAEWISRHLDRPHLRLGYAIPKENSQYTFWHNVNNLHMIQLDNRNVALPANIVPRFRLISYRSYIEINKFLSCPVTIDKYNADICIVPKNTEPFVELEWEWIKIGNIILRNITSWKRYSMRINLKNMPIEMKMKMMVLDCELYQSGTIRPGDDIYVHVSPKDLFLDFRSKKINIL